jgi:ATP-dependent DNA helicase RecG
MRLKDIDGERLQWFLRKARAERNLDIDSKTGTEEILNRLRLMKDEELTNAAILLFGKEPQRFFLQAETRCARFKGLNVTEPFIDMKVIGGDLFSHVEETERFVLRNISKAAWIEPGKIERQEKWEYPPDAIREAITNAVCHRDYESSGSVQIRIFDDRIEIWNPGQLPESLTVEDLKKKHESKPRNRLIARCFFLVKFIEEWGTGTNKIVDWCLKQDLPEPLFEEAAGSFVVNLRKFHITEEALQKLNERERAIIQRVQENQRITSGEIQRMFDVSRDTVNRYLKNLLERRLIDKRGKGKTTYYTLQ